MPAHRGPQGQGSVHRRTSDGLWAAVADLGRDPATGQRQRRTFYGRTQKIALAKRKQFLRDLEEGLVSAKATRRKPYTVETWLAYWLDNVIQPHREPTTFDSYTRIIKKNVLPMLGPVLLDQLDTEMIEAWLKTMQARGVGVRTQQSALTRLRTALGEALARRQQTHVRYNAAVPVRMPQARRTRVAAPNVTEARALLDSARGERLEAFIVVCLGLGLRKGEALGLRWDDLDFATNQVTIRRRVSHINHVGNIVREGTKHHPDQQWTLDMPQMVTDALRAHRARQKLERLPAGYVFCDRSGGMLSPITVTTFFVRVRERAGLPHKTLHSLRHDCASLLLDQGVPLVVVSNILRHEKLGTTADIYSHLTPGLRRGAADTMDSILRRVTEG